MNSGFMKRKILITQLFTKILYLQKKYMVKKFSNFSMMMMMMMIVMIVLKELI